MRSQVERRSDRLILSKMTHPIQDLCDLLRECGAVPRIGLEAQGHIPTVERMLAGGKTWDEIGKAIGWHGPTAQDWYRAYLTRNINQPE